MRFSKFALIAAAGFGAVAALHAVDTVVTNPIANYSAAVAAGDRIVFNISNINITYTGTISGTGDLVKTGNGVLQIDTWGSQLASGYYLNRTWDGTSFGPQNQLQGNTTGGLVIDSGTVTVSGYLQQWYNNPLPQPVSFYTGFSSITLGGPSARLSFEPSRVNVLRTLPTLDGNPDPAQGLGPGFKVNFANNVYGAANTALSAGVDSTAVLIIQTTNARANGVGILEGKGVVVIGGNGDFRLQNNSTFTGDVQLAGGTLTLGSVAGGSLATAESVNLGIGTRSWLVLSDSATTNGVGEFRPAYAPAASQLGNQNAVLRVEGDQVINNFQKRFSDLTSVPRAPSVSDVHIYDFTDGSGTNITLADADASLTVRQTYDAVYNGTISGAGAFIKEGSAKLALTGTGSNVALLDVRDGTLIASVQMLGTGVVNIATGAVLELVQNDSGTLAARIQGLAGASLRFGTDSTVVDYRAVSHSVAAVIGKVDALGKALIGSVNISVAQTDFAGNISVTDGLTLNFSPASGDAFANAQSISLHSGTTLAFGVTNQTFRNFTGEADTRINLGKGTATLIQNSADSVYAGEIFGSGGFIKDGSSTFTLSGRNSGAGTSSTQYLGATIVKGGTLVLAGVNQLPNTSALVLAGGNVSVTANQTFGALYGGATSLLQLGSSSLTVGFTAAQRQQRINEITAGGYQGAAYYLPSTDIGLAGYNQGTTVAYLRDVAYHNPKADAAAVAVAAAKTAIDTAVASGLPADKAIAIQKANDALAALNAVAAAPVPSVDAASGTSVTAAAQTAITSLNAVIAAIPTNLAGAQALAATAQTDSATYATAHNAAAQNLANSLAFAGSITGTGGLTKIGTETLTLTGVNTFTGATQILGGKLRADYDALSGTSGVAISAGTTFELNAALGEVGTFSGALSGAGDFIKVGLGEVTLAGNTTAYTGTLTVAEGVLRFNAEGTSPGTVVVNSGATLALNTPTAGLTTTYTAGITSSGTIQKEGAGTLKLTNLTSLAGSGFNVLGGTLAVGNLGTGSGDINIAAGSTFETVTSSATTFSGQISGAGTFRVSGASSLTLDGTPPYPFTGIVEVAEAAVLVMQPGKNNLLTSASIVLKDDAVLDLSGTTQTFTGLTSDSANAQVNLSNGVLNFNVATGVTTAFSGNLVGPGTVNKSGDGTLSLQADIPVGLAGARIFNVAAGTLEATSNAVDNSTVNVQSGATFSLYNNVAGDANFTDYSTTTITLASGATLAKSGVGVVKIDDFGGVAGALAHVQAGTLFVVNPGNFPGAVFTGVVVDAGATYKLNVTGSSFTNDGSTANHITGAGSLAADGAGTLVLAGQQLYTGNTVLSNGATLQLDATASVSGITGLAMNGLAGTAGTSVSIPGATDLTINQLVDGEFDGTFVGGNNITVTGTAVLTLANTATSTVTGALTVDGGKLEVSATNTKAIDLTNAGELRIEVTGVNETYAGTVNATGTGNKLVKTGTGTLDLAGTLAQVTGFSGSVGVAEGTLVLDPSSLAGLNGTITGLTTEGAGTLVLDVAANQQMPVVAVTGDGALEKSGAGTLFVNGGQLSGFTGLFTVSQGTLGGNFTTGGDLTIASGAKLAPGNSPGTVVVGGNFNLNSGATLEVEINAATSDKVVVTGSATIAGALVVKQDSTPNSTKSAPGTSYSILTAAGGVTGTFSNEVNGVVQLAAADIVATGISRVRLTHTTNEITMTTVGAVSLIGGLHDGLGGLVAALDAGTLPPAVLAAVDSAVIGGNAASVVNNLSPLGYAAEYAMAQDADNRLHAGLHDRLEQRRYDRASTLTLDEAPWEAFASATGSFADNKQATDTPTFNYRTFGGYAGLDKKVSNDLTVGAAVAYDNGSADLHDNGGKIEMSRATLTVFGGTQITSRWYVDGGLTGGYAKYDGKRRTALGSLKGSNDGLSVGGFVETGTIFAVTKDFHITPYLGAAYTHHEFDGVTESGNASALKTESWSNDSLRVKVGSGFGWFIPMEDWKLKLGLDAAFAHELIDTDSEIEASFASGGSKFSTTAAALPQDSVGLTPSIGVEFDDTLSASIGYSYEMGFDGRSYQSVNFSVRKRF